MNILEIANKIKNAGGNLYLVGGAIRDEFLGKSNYDEDYCVQGLTENEFLDLFPEAISRGKAFKVFDLENKEFALARKDIKLGNGHKGFEIISNKDISIEDDLARRDITINAIAKDIITGKIIDPFGGINDIKNKVIKAINEHFVEDPLRVYRVARFAAILEFKVDEDTITLMKSQKNELNTLSRERVFGEFRKAINSNKPSIFFDILRKAEVLDVHFEEIYNLIGKIQPEKYHPEGDSYAHTMLAIDNSVNLTKDEIIRFSVLVHDLGKGKTPEEMLPHHYGHEKRGIEPLKNLSKRLGIPKKWEKAGTIAILEHMRGGIFYKMTPEKQVSFIERVEKSFIGLDGLEIVVKCDRNRNDKKEDIGFAQIGKRMIDEINGETIKRKYNISEGKFLKEKMHQERVLWIKQEFCKNKLNQN